LADDTPRLLHRRSPHGYTRNPERALRGEPEAVNTEVQGQITLAAQQAARDELAHEWAKCRSRPNAARAARSSISSKSRGCRAGCIAACG